MSAIRGTGKHLLVLSFTGFDPKETCRVNGGMTAYRSKALTAAGEHFQRHLLRA
jgi:hypothetical protein